MGFFDKLLSLNEDKEDEPEEQKEEKQQAGETKRPTSPRPVVRVQPEDIQPLEDLYNQLSRTQLQLGQMQADYERRKGDVMEELDDLSDQIEETVDTLRDKYGIPEEDDNYSLNLPKEDQEHGYFLRDGHGEKNLDPEVNSEDESTVEVGESST